MGQPRLFVSAGDPSGDQAVARVIADLQHRLPGLQTFGLGGPCLAQLGQRQLAAPEKLAVMGFWEVARRFWFFGNLLRTCQREIARQNPGAILLVDYPGFNLRLARRVRSLGIPIVYYISPQVWAWGQGRIADIRDLIDRMLVILPFEEPFFRSNGVKATFVGHYLMEDIPREFIGTAPPGHRRLALLPGSRRQEVSRMLPEMLKVAAEFNRRHGWTSVVAARRGVYDYDSLCDRYNQSGVTTVYDDSRRVIVESDLVLSASGTATLEVGIIGRPMVIVYKTGWLTYQIARRLVKLDKIALINLVLGENEFPELVQGDATARRMMLELEHLANDAKANAQALERLRTVPSILGGAGASERAASEIAGFL